MFVHALRIHYAGGCMDRPISPKSKRNYVTQLIVTTIGLAGACAVYVYASQNVNSGKAYNVEKGALVVSTVVEGNFTEYLPIRGTVEPQDTIFIDAIDGGRVEQVYLQEGALVEKGQPIVKLSNTSLQLNVLAREAEVSEQINNMRNTRLALEQNQLKLKRDVIELDYEVLRLEKEFARSKKLIEKNLISKRTFEQIQDELQFQITYRETVKESQQKRRSYNLNN